MPPLIVELVGPAGAGKTTLTQALSQRSCRVLPAILPYYRDMGQAPFFARNSLLALPTLIALYRDQPLVVAPSKRNDSTMKRTFPRWPAWPSLAYVPQPGLPVARRPGAGQAGLHAAAWPASGTQARGRAGRHGDWLSRREIAWMVILNGWHRVLRRQGSKEKDIVILDQGPIYLLTELYLFGPRVLASRTAERWWAGMYKQWADALDLVIWLDAADKVLAERIRMRDQWHIVKDESDEGISEFLAQFRTAYDKVISMLSANSPGLRLLCLDTGEEALAETMNRVLAACSAGEGHRGTGCGTPASEG